MQARRKIVRLVTLLFFVSFVVALACPVAQAQGSTNVTVSPSNSTPAVGQTITVTIAVSDVQNLYALQVTLNYNNAVLQLTNQQPDLGTNAVSSGGVLYGSPVTTDINSWVSGGLYYNTSLSTETEYNLFATSAGSAQSFNGSGTIAVLTFRVVAAGGCPLTLSSTLSDHPLGVENSNPIAHSDISGSVTATEGSSPTQSSSPSATSTASPSSSPSSQPSSTPMVPEFPTLAVLPLLVLVPLVLLVPRLRRQVCGRTPRA